VKTYTKTERALVEELKSLDLLPLITENEPSDRLDEFYRVTTVPGQPIMPELWFDSDRLLPGITQIDIFVPRASGRGVALERAEHLTQHFYSGKAIVTDGSHDITVVNSYISSGNYEKAYYRVFVTIAWQARIDNHVEAED
jgi:hypothetical protein